LLCPHGMPLPHRAFPLFWLGQNVSCPPTLVGLSGAPARLGKCPRFSCLILLDLSARGLVPQPEAHGCSVSICPEAWRFFLIKPLRCARSLALRFLVVHLRRQFSFARLFSMGSLVALGLLISYDSCPACGCSSPPIAFLMC